MVTRYRVICYNLEDRLFPPLFKLQFSISISNYSRWTAASFNRPIRLSRASSWTTFSDGGRCIVSIWHLGIRSPVGGSRTFSINIRWHWRHDNKHYCNGHRYRELATAPSSSTNEHFPPSAVQPPTSSWLTSPLSSYPSSHHFDNRPLRSPPNPCDPIQQPIPWLQTCHITCVQRKFPRHSGKLRRRK